MAIAVTHTFVSAKLDDADATLIRPSNWNASHTLTMATSKLLGRATAAAGAVEEISISSDLAFTGTTLGIASDAITYAKLQNITAASKLLGRGSASGAGDVEEVTIGTGLSMTGTVLSSTGAATVLRGSIDGLVMAWVSNTSFSVAAGQATDSANAAVMDLAAAITKTTAAWTVGTGNGGLDTGAIAANTWYHVFLIQRSDSGVTDVVFSTGLTLTTPPTNYDRKRRIGSIRTNASSQFTAFVQVGNQFLWNVAASDLSGAWTTTATNLTLTVPTGVSVEALGYMSGTSSAGNSYFVLYSPLVADFTAAIAAAQLVSQTAGFLGSADFRVLTNTSAQVRRRSSDASGTGAVATIGWIDPRGRDA